MEDFRLTPAVAVFAGVAVDDRGFASTFGSVLTFAGEATGVDF
jgi:hypothetical protein